MEIKKTKDIKSDEGITMVVYGPPKTGKTSFAASTRKFGKTLVFDFENGTKYLGERGIDDVDVAPMSDWFTNEDAKGLRATIDPYDFIVVDPVGEAMDFLITGNQIVGAKYRQQDGSLTMAGWGAVKEKMRGFLKFLRSSGKTIILIFHDDRRQINEEWYHSLMIATKLKDVIPGMVEIISYLTVITRDEKQHHVLYTPARGGNYDSGDRTGRVPEVVEISELNGWGDFLAALKPKQIPAPEDREDKAEPPQEEKAGESEPIDVEFERITDSIGEEAKIEAEGLDEGDALSIY